MPTGRARGVPDQGCHERATLARASPRRSRQRAWLRWSRRSWSPAACSARRSWSRVTTIRRGVPPRAAPTAGCPPGRWRCCACSRRAGAPGRSPRPSASARARCRATSPTAITRSAPTAGLKPPPTPCATARPGPRGPRRSIGRRDGEIRPAGPAHDRADGLVAHAVLRREVAQALVPRPRGDGRPAGAVELGPLLLRRSRRVPSRNRRQAGREAGGEARYAMRAGDVGYRTRVLDPRKSAPSIWRFLTHRLAWAARGAILGGTCTSLPRREAADGRPDRTLTPASPRTPLVGRERELATLRDALAAALAGRGSLVLIGGRGGHRQDRAGRGAAGRGGRRGARWCWWGAATTWPRRRPTAPGPRSSPAPRAATGCPPCRRRCCRRSATARR